MTNTITKQEVRETIADLCSIQSDIEATRQNLAYIRSKARQAARTIELYHQQELKALNVQMADPLQPVPTEDQTNRVSNIFQSGIFIENVVMAVDELLDDDPALTQVIETLRAIL